MTMTCRMNNDQGRSYTMTMNHEDLIASLHAAYDYTGDNNRDLLRDSLFSLEEVNEELEAERCYQYLIAHISRHAETIDYNLKSL